ncbi:hypothetical protein GTA30_16220 [Roseobacter sp. HKCCD6503]|nr:MULTISPECIES: pentapeptide repeat-containing protein [unclassified Roseobacter]NNV31306.1 hypothetical protein [Roseobacter sp. HKCCD9061]NNW37912.1 hypothetical protein [Roseobacter sp. HKCCD9117-2]NNX31643.1 hypothetical protein [Roseobacter sp. HKCCD6503]NOE03086.1 hypothetical protein [Roseobacter sp. HKCCD7387]
MAFLAFATVTLLRVEDADFFIPSRETVLPLIGVSIPTYSFFIFAPLLGTALYVYLHLHVRKMAEALATPDPLVKGQPLERHLNTWLLNDFILKLRRDAASTTRRMDWIANSVTLVLIWIAGPLVLFGFWLRSWPAHDEYLSVFLLVLALFSTHVAIGSWLSVRDAFRVEGRPGLATLTYGMGLTASFLVMAHLTLVKTEIGTVRDLTAPITLRVATSSWELSLRLHEFWTEMEPVNLRNLQAVEIAPERLDHETARHSYRIDWCGREELTMEVCGPYTDWADAITDRVQSARAVWCTENESDLSSTCSDHFGTIDRRFHEDWRAHRSAEFINLSPPDLTGADLRNADLDGAILVGVSLTRVQIQGADLTGAQLEGANLQFAQMRGADLRNAQMQEANLMQAQMQGANLRGAEMQRAVLWSAQMQGANLERAQMQGADLWDAQMQRAILWNAQMQGANLTRAKMQEADMASAQLQGSNLSAAEMHGVDLTRAQMSEGTLLRAARLRGAASGQVDQITTNQLRPFWPEIFADGSVPVPPELRPTHWPRFALDDEHFQTEWRKWQANPEGYRLPDPVLD